MCFINSFQIFLLLLLILEEGASILFPNLSLLCVNFFFVNLFLFFLLYLSGKIFSHLLFLLLCYPFTSLLLLFLFSELVLDVSHHLLILCSDLLLLVLNDRVSEGSHDSLNLLLAFFFLFLPFSL